jgi:hypothetical protein
MLLDIEDSEASKSFLSILLLCEAVETMMGEFLRSL